MHRNNIAAAHIAQQLADGGLVGRHGHVDAAAFHKFAITASTDERHHSASTHSLGQQRCHDVVLVVVGDSQEDVGTVDIFVFEQDFIGGVAVQYQYLRGQGGGQLLAATRLVLDELDRVTLVGQFASQASADVAAPCHHDSPRCALAALQCAHGAMCLLPLHQKQNFVVVLQPSFGL